MRKTLLFIAAGFAATFIMVSGVSADVLEMQNGDRYSGKVLAVSATTVVLNSEILGKINVPRAKVANVRLGSNIAGLPLAPVSTPTPALALPAPAPSLSLANTNTDLAAAFQQLGGDTNFIGQIRQQMLGGSPEAAGKFDEMVNGLMTGQINVNDLRKQAQESATQLRALKKELGSEADESLDVYLKILDAFVNETGPSPAN